MIAKVFIFLFDNLDNFSISRILSISWFDSLFNVMIIMVKFSEYATRSNGPHVFSLNMNFHVVGQHNPDEINNLLQTLTKKIILNFIDIILIDAKFIQFNPFAHIYTKFFIVTIITTIGNSRGNE